MARERLDLDIDLAPDAEALVERERYDAALEDAARRQVRALVANPEAVDSYARRIGVLVQNDRHGFHPTQAPSLEGSPVEQVIITKQALQADFQVLADWKTQRGVPTVVRTLEWIQANYRHGSDLQETIYASRFNGRDIVQKSVEANVEYLVIWTREGDWAFYNSKLQPKPPGLGPRDVLRAPRSRAHRGARPPPRRGARDHLPALRDAPGSGPEDREEETEGEPQMKTRFPRPARTPLAGAALAVAVAVASPALAADTYQFDKSHTTVGFKVRHIFTMLGGMFQDFSGTIKVDRAKPESSSVEFTIQAASVFTNDAKRDEHLKSPDFFDTATHPTITFKSTSVKPSGNNDSTRSKSPPMTATAARPASRSA